MKRTVPVSCATLIVLASSLIALAGTPSRPRVEAPADDSSPQASASAAASQPATPQYTSVRPLEDNVTLATLENGLTVIVQENHVAAVATVRCYVKNTGSAFEGRYLGCGLSHVLEHVVAGGSTTERTEKEIREIVEGLGGATNAYTTNEMTSFFIDCPAKKVATGISLLADAMQHVKFEPREFARELKVVRRELADDEVDRQRVLGDMLNRTVYTTHPVRNPVIGYLEVLNGTTNQAIIDFYHERYIPNNQVFVVVGDVKTQDVLDRVARAWTGTPRGRVTYVAMGEEPAQLSPRETIREMEGKTYDMVLAWPTVKLSHPDMYALDLAAYILGEGESSRLVRRLKNDRQLVLAIDASSSTPFFVNGYFAVSASSQPEHWQAASEAILREVYRLRDELVDPAELAKVKKQKAVEWLFDRQTVQEAAESLGHAYIAADDPLFDQAYAKNIQRVTAEEIRDVARRYLVPQRLNRVVITPPGGAPKLSAQAAAASRSRTRLVRLDNGLRVLLKRHSNLPLINIQAFVLGGAAVDDEKTAGRAALVAAMLDQGSNEATAEELARYFDSIGGRLAIGSGHFTLFGSATTLREDFPQAAAHFAACFTHPTFPRKEFAKVQSLALAAIANRSADPREEIFDLFYDHLPTTTPYHLNPGGQAESVRQLSEADLRQYHAKYFRPQNMVVTVFGDIDPDEALALVRKLFGQLPATPAAPAIDFHRPNALSRSSVSHRQTHKDIGALMLGFASDSIYDQKDHGAMIVLDTVLSGYGYPSGWLHNELRGAGLVYFVEAFDLTGPAPGYLTVFSQTQPDKVGEVVARIRADLERAKQGKISGEEFHAAVRQILALHAQENTTIAEQARLAALDELYGLGYDYDQGFDNRIQAVTLDDVVRVAQKYLTESVLVTASPEKNGPTDRR
jgi:zinc protease